MTVERMDHIGVVVEDLAAAIEFFVELGLERQNEGSVEGAFVDRIVGLEGVQTKFAFMQTPDGHDRLELIEFVSPPSPDAKLREPSNQPGIRHLAFVVDDIEAVLARLQDHDGELVGEVENYKDIYRLCYLRGPAGIIVELAEKMS